VHGNTIELKESSGVPDGQEVEIQMRVRPKTSTPGEGFLRTEGALVDDEEWDAIMAEIHQARRLERRAPFADMGDT
jgi:hypothetical protein